MTKNEDITKTDTNVDYERTAITPPTPDVSDLMEEARAMVKRAGHPRHSFALGYASRVLALAAAGSPIHPDDARMAYAVYRAAAGPAAPAEARRARPAAITTPPDSLRAEFAEAHRRQTERRTAINEAAERLREHLTNPAMLSALREGIDHEHLVHPFVD